MILVDSSVWIDFVNACETPQTLKLKEILGVEQVAIGDIILTEVLQGCINEKEHLQTLEIFNRLEFVSLGGYRVCIAAAQNYRKLRSLGYTVRKTIDAIIATRCILDGYTLLHNDRDFIPFEKHLGLKCLI